MDPDVGSSAFVFSSEMLLRTQVLERAADDAIQSGQIARDVCGSRRTDRSRPLPNAATAFAAITVFGFVAAQVRLGRHVNSLA
jgi:hypothetical protein